LIQPLHRAQIIIGVSKAYFHWASYVEVVMEWLLGDEDVWSVELEYRLRRTITFDPTVGSRSNF